MAGLAGKVHQSPDTYGSDSSRGEAPHIHATLGADAAEKGLGATEEQLLKVKPLAHGVRGNPGPFGLLCFGMTTCMLMFITTEWSPGGLLPTVMAYALFYGGFGQLVAGILELIRGSVFAGTAFSSYGAFWMGWSIWKYWEKTSQVASVTEVALKGDTLWCGLWGFLTLFFFVVTLRKNGCLQTVFGTLFTTFFLLAGANYSHKCKLAAGYVGFFCGASAIYTAIAELYKEELGWNMPGLTPTNYI